MFKERSNSDVRTTLAFAENQRGIHRMGKVPKFEGRKGDEE